MQVRFDRRVLLLGCLILAGVGGFVAYDLKFRPPTTTFNTVAPCIVPCSNFDRG